MTFLDFFIIFIIIIILFLYIKSYYAEVVYIKSNIDNRNYLVRKLPDCQKAADYLASLNKDILQLIKHLMAKYPDKIEIKRLFANFNPDNVSEGSSQSGYTSYSVNKGERIVLCIRQKDAEDSFVDRNTIMYVICHEIGHLATASIGHDQEFWDNFKFILNEAINIDLYTKIDFAKSPAKYCGISITSSIL